MNITIREAELADFPWLRQLAIQSSIYGIPHGRTVRNREVQAVAGQHLKNLEITAGTDPNFVILVATIAETGERLGYIMLDLNHVEASTAESQSLIHDLAVEPEHWGKHVVHRLVDAAARTTAERGLGYMVGEVTAGNRRTLVQALRLGFEIERYQIVMRCSLQGPATMPGRPQDEKAHDVGRKRRRAARLRKLRRLQSKQALTDRLERDEER